MDEEKKTLGRSKIYSGEPESQIKSRTQQPTPAGDRRSRRAEPIDTKPKEHLVVEPGRRRKDMETDAKMHRLWALLGVLVVILVVAIIYEIVLGHASLETGSQRMNQAAQETEQTKETEQVKETEQESESEASADIVSEDGSAADSSGSDEEAADTDTVSGDGGSADGEAGGDATLAGLNG